MTEDTRPVPEPPPMRLRSSDLLSRWGFNDGEVPDFWYFQYAEQ
jgi:hypothetical protein